MRSISNALATTACQTTIRPRAAYGLPKVTSYADIHASDPATQQAIAAVHPNINTIDPLVGALAEDHLPGASVGPLVAAGVRLQFERLRDGDRFWYDKRHRLHAIGDRCAAPTPSFRYRPAKLGITNVQTNVFRDP